MCNGNTLGNCSCEVCMWFGFCGRNVFMYGDDVMRVQGVSKRRKEFVYGRTDTKMMMASIGPSRRGWLWTQHEWKKRVENRLDAFRNYVTAFRCNKWKLLFVNGCKFKGAICKETEFSVACRDGQKRECADRLWWEIALLWWNKRAAFNFAMTYLSIVMMPRTPLTAHVS